MTLDNIVIKKEPGDITQTPNKNIVKIESGNTDARLLITNCECCEAPIDPRWTELAPKKIKLEPLDPPPPNNDENKEESKTLSPLIKKRSPSVSENNNPPPTPPKVIKYESNNFNNQRRDFYRWKRPFYNRGLINHPYNFNYSHFAHFGNNINRNWGPYWNYNKKFYKKKRWNNSTKEEPKPEKEIRVLKMTSSNDIENTSSEQCVNDVQNTSPEMQNELPKYEEETIQSVSSPSTFSDKENMLYTSHCMEDSQSDFFSNENSQSPACISLIDENSSNSLVLNDDTEGALQSTSLKSLIDINNEEFLILDEIGENSNSNQSLRNPEMQEQLDSSSEISKDIESLCQKTISKNNVDHGDEVQEKNPSSEAVIICCSLRDAGGSRNADIPTGTNKVGLCENFVNNNELQTVNEEGEIEVIKEIGSNGEIECIVNKCKEVHICASCFVKKKKLKKDTDVICLGKRKSSKENVPIITLEDVED